MKRVDVILLDFGGTLDADGVPWARRFHAAYRAAGGGLAFPAFEPLFQASDDALLQLPDIHALGYLGTVRAQAQTLLPLLPDGHRIAADALAEPFCAAALQVVARNRPVLERLGRSHRLGIVSNFTGNLEPCLSELGLLSYFATVSDSALLGMEKPDPRIFLSTLDALGATASRSWMVGDNFETDIRPAAGLGFHACWMAPTERQAAPKAPPHARVHALPELLDLVA